ncbi:MAG: S-layer homology domain-containing protein [Micrococcus sp.]|nr:S-layer homology domain-containing protein [Micrococcus sp.]
MKFLSALAALALVLPPTGSAVAAPSPGMEAPVIAESVTSEPVPVTVDGVDVAELEELPEAPAAAEVPEMRSGRLGACAVRDFRDIPPGHSYYRYVHWMACEGLTAGYANGTFGLSRQLSRGEAAMFLYRLSGERHQPGTTVDFRDVPVGGAYFTAVSWMEEKGYSAGYANGTFDRTRSISRGELASFLYRMSGQAHRTSAYSPYSDMSPQSAFFTAAAWLESTGMISGYTDRSFRPNRPVTRGEAATFLYSFDRAREGTLPTSNANRWTTVLTPLHATANPLTRAMRDLPPQTGVVRLAEQGSMTQVRAGSTTGWVNSDFLTRGEPGTTRTPYPTPTRYEHRAANTMAAWCWDIPMTTFDGTHAWAEYEVRGYPEWPSTYEVQELIGLGHDLDADSVPARAVQLHECAHILQYRTYRYDGDALDARMDRIYPNGTSGGTEHMADCMADAMGARRVSSSDDGSTWTVGYGGTCTAAQMSAARKVIAGVRP